MHKQIPNALTILRFLMVPVFMYFLFVSRVPQRVMISLIIFVLAALTDYVDGTLARKWEVVSDFGKIMDPLADKFLVLTALAALCWLPPYNLNVVIFFVILARELLITILREVYQQRGIVVAADSLGKLKTVMQMFGVIFALTAWAFMPSVSDNLRKGVNIWFWLVAVITVASGFNYLRIMYKKEA
ncbi:MAG TPA: CDP-diacylglycerol--glycerol-3-phosphate 3-phosphatidyltransferase [Candidatus Cloacimonadota bacterium]|nr:CDP-diacylglycerol--glycerol-3-phosphate 3-phosphatidyltransferase [Candidatus Cloacimonadota bacterium]